MKVLERGPCCRTQALGMVCPPGLSWHWFRICPLDYMLSSLRSSREGRAFRAGLCGLVPSVPSPDFILLCSLRVPVGGAGPPRNNVVGGSPLAKGMAATIHPGGGSLSSPATATRPTPPLTTPQAQAQHQAASPAMGSCLRHSTQPAASQARSTIPTGTHQTPGDLTLLKNLTRECLRDTKCEKHFGPGLKQSMVGQIVFAYQNHKLLLISGKFIDLSYYPILAAEMD